MSMSKKSKTSKTKAQQRGKKAKKEKKPVHSNPNADVCQTCGKLTEKLYLVDNVMMCAGCKKAHKI